MSEEISPMSRALHAIYVGKRARIEQVAEQLGAARKKAETERTDSPVTMNDLFRAAARVNSVSPKDEER